MEILIHLLANPNPRIRERAAYALGDLRDKSAIPPLLHAYLNDRDAEVRQLAREALGELHYL